MLVAAEVSFFAMLVVCYLLEPHAPTQKEGISYYGNYLHTLVPYTVAFIASGLFTFGAATTMRAVSTELRRLKMALYILAILLICLTLVPSLYNSFVGLVHVGIGSGIFLDQMAIGLWFVRRRAGNFIDYGLVAVMIASGGAAGLSVPDVIDVMFVSQVIYEVAAGVLIVRALAYMLSEARDTKRGTLSSEEISS
jgi:hypothetical protein